VSDTTSYKTITFSANELTEVILALQLRIDVLHERIRKSGTNEYRAGVLDAAKSALAVAVAA
jgi:hypothetical protein